MMLDDEIKNWSVLVEAKAITLEGRLSTKGLRMLTDLIPFPTETVALNEDQPEAGGTAPESVKSSSPEELTITTSKKYFQHVSLLIDSLRTESRSSWVAKARAGRWSTRGALEIDRMPVLNVDEELIAYGAGVSQTLRKYCGIPLRTRASTRQLPPGNRGRQSGVRVPLRRGYPGGTSLALRSHR